MHKVPIFWGSAPVKALFCPARSVVANASPLLVDCSDKRGEKQTSGNHILNRRERAGRREFQRRAQRIADGEAEQAAEVMFVTIGHVDHFIP
jgi:hypothetical protein